MTLVSLNENKQDILEYVVQVNYQNSAKTTSGLVGVHQNMFFDIGNVVTEKSVASIIKPISVSKIEGVYVIRDNRLVSVSPSEFKALASLLNKA